MRDLPRSLPEKQALLGGRRKQPAAAGFASQLFVVVPRLEAEEGKLKAVLAAACLGVAEVFAFRPNAAWQQFFRESLTIGGWVAMWRPLEIYLYRWWPLLRLGRIYRKLSVMKIEVRSPQAPQNRN